MQNISGLDYRDDRWARIILAGGIVFVLALIFVSPENVFFSGDGGLKFLMVQQVERGGSAIYLDPDKPEWVREIWEQGFFPFQDPFVYQVPSGRVVAFPPLFQIITAPFYKVFGFRGLFLIPLVSILILWFSFWKILRRLEVRRDIKFLLLAVLVFGCPLTVYGGFFWEHALAVALGFAGAAFIVRNKSGALIQGLLFGMSIWFRPEMIVFCGLTVVALIIFSPRRSGRNAFIAGTGISFGGFLFFNNMIYDGPLGAHALQLDLGTIQVAYKPGFFEILTHINFRLLEYLPVVIFFPAVLYLLLRKKLISTRVSQLTFIITCFLIIIPFFLPNAGGKQWGPRYLLPVVPAILILYALISQRLRIARSARIVFVSLALIGISLNSIGSYFTIRSDYKTRVAPALAVIKADPAPVVIFQNQYIAQEMTSAFKAKHFFVAETGVLLDSLLPRIESRGVNNIEYVSYNYSGGSQVLNSGLTDSVRKGNYLIISWKKSR